MVIKHEHAKESSEIKICINLFVASCMYNLTSNVMYIIWHIAFCTPLNQRGVGPTYIYIIDQEQHGVHGMLRICPLCGIFYFSWNNTTDSFLCLFRKTKRGRPKGNYQSFQTAPVGFLQRPLYRQSRGLSVVTLIIILLVLISNKIRLIRTQLIGPTIIKLGIFRHNVRKRVIVGFTMLHDEFDFPARRMSTSADKNC